MADVKAVIRKLFPIFSAAASMGGPLGTMAAQAVGAALKLDKPPDASPDSLNDALAAGITDPNLRAQLIKSEQDFHLQLQKMNLEYDEHTQELVVQDRASARARQIAVKDWMPNVLALICVSAFVGCLFALIKHDIASASRDAFMFLLGILAKMVADVYGYYFGSSAGSAAKEETIKQISMSK